MHDVVGEVWAGVGIVTLNRPRVLNALDTRAVEQVLEWLGRHDEDPNIHVVVLTGTGDRAFCSGADLRGKAVARAPGEEPETWPWQRLLASPSRKPTIAALNGSAYGGGVELALSCDLIVASEAAMFALPEVRRGLIAGGGGLTRLPRLIPHRVATEMAMTGRPMTVDEALSWGLVNRVVPRRELLPAALRLAAEVIKGAPRAVAASKEILSAVLESPPAHVQSLNDSRLQELHRTRDAIEGARAFIEKREPLWVGD